MGFEMCPELSKMIGAVSELVLAPGTETLEPFHRRCAGGPCNGTVDVTAKRLPTDEDSPNRINVSLSIDGLASCG